MKTSIFRSISMLTIASPLLIANTLFASETDDRIEAAAKNSYVFRTFLKDDSVKTESEDGVVTLTGTVAHHFNKKLANDTVENLPAVKSVKNQIKVTNEMPTEMTDEISDKWTALKVKSMLAYHRNVTAIGTDVTASGKTVTLKGKANSNAQKELTAEYALDVDGVSKVNNEMTVVEPAGDAPRTIAEAIDDASITAQIKGSLFTHRSTSALMTGIKTQEGVVTISGEASNAAEKSLVTKLVTDINGVVSVTNNMTIK